MFLELLSTSLRRRKCNNYPTRDDLFKLPVIRCTTHAESQHIVTLFAHASFRSEAPLKVTSLFSLCDRSLRGSTQRNFPNSVTFKSDAIDQFANSRSCGLRLMAVVLLPFQEDPTTRRFYKERASDKDFKTGANEGDESVLESGGIQTRNLGQGKFINIHSVVNYE